MHALAHDIRFAVRQVRTNPAFSTAVVLTLALGIGANISIFGLLDQVLVRRMPVTDPDQLVILSGPGPNSGWITRSSDTVFPLSHPMYEDLRDLSSVFSGVLARYPTDLHVGYRGGTEVAQGSLVSGTYFEVLGVGADVGRVLARADDGAGAPAVAVLGHSYWTRRFGANPAVLGEEITVNGHAATIVGVAAAGFRGIQLGRVADLYVPLSMKPFLTPVWNRIGERRVMWLEVVGRLRPGLTLERARPQIDGLYRQILETETADMSGRPQSFLDRFQTKKLDLLSGRYGIPELRHELGTSLVLLMAMVGLIVLIACANVANLLFARATSRQAEVAVRLALGAARGRIVRQLLIESLLLSLMAAAAGLLIASWTTGALLEASPLDNVARSLRAEPDLRAAGFALGLALVTTLLAGLAPALRATDPALGSALRDQSARLVAAGGSQRLRRGLVVGQVALSVLLLVGAGLLSRSLSNLRGLDPGFDKQGLLSFGLDPVQSGHSQEQSQALFPRLRERLLGVPGVSAVTMASEPLMTNSHDRATVNVPGYTPQEGEDMNPNVLAVGPDFLETIGLPLLAGREIDERDAAGSPRVAVVNEAFARYFFGDESPVGRRFAFRWDERTEIQIVGMVADARLNDVRETVRRFVYVPYPQYGDLAGLVFYVRGDRDAADLAGDVRVAVRELDADLPLTDLRTIQATIEELLFVDRIVGLLATVFGVLATALAAVGLFGVMGYAVTRRTREIGVRVALGADRSRILMLIAREIAVLAGLGLAIGLPCGWALGLLFESRLFGLTAFDPLTLVGVVAIVGSAAVLAGALPALRATRVDPAVALRCD